MYCENAKIKGQEIRDAKRHDHMIKLVKWDYIRQQMQLDAEERQRAEDMKVRLIKWISLTRQKKILMRLWDCKNAKREALLSRIRRSLAQFVISSYYKLVTRHRQINDGKRIK